VVQQGERREDIGDQSLMGVALGYVCECGESRAEIEGYIFDKDHYWIGLYLWCLACERHFRVAR
jgi:hypothetical protein